MTCEEARREIHADFLAKGGGKFGSTLKTHLLSCRRCRGQNGILAKILQTVQMIKIEEIPETLANELAVLRALPTSTSRFNKEERKKNLIALFLILLILLSGAIFYVGYENNWFTTTPGHPEKKMRSDLVQKKLQTSEMSQPQNLSQEALPEIILPLSPQTVSPPNNNNNNNSDTSFDEIGKNLKKNLKARLKLKKNKRATAIHKNDNSTSRSEPSEKDLKILALLDQVQKNPDDPTTAKSVPTLSEKKPAVPANKNPSKNSTPQVKSEIMEAVEEELCPSQNQSGTSPVSGLLVEENLEDLFAHAESNSYFSELELGSPEHLENETSHGIIVPLDSIWQGLQHRHVKKFSLLVPSGSSNPAKSDPLAKSNPDNPSQPHQSFAHVPPPPGTLYQQPSGELQNAEEVSFSLNPDRAAPTFFNNPLPQKLPNACTIY